MKRFAWSAVAGFGVAGLLVAAPSARPDERTQASQPGTTATDTNKTGKTSSDTPSGARGSGMGGTSTGARPGEVTGAAPAGEAAATASQQRNQVTGKVEKFDRGTRTLSLANSDKTLKLTDDTEVMKDGQKVSPGQIMEGDEVRASYSGSGDTLRVDRLEVMTSASTGGTTPGPSKSGSPPSSGAGTSSEKGRSSGGAPETKP
jgi:hypothetical protein